MEKARVRIYIAWMSVGLFAFTSVALVPLCAIMGYNPDIHSRIGVSMLYTVLICVAYSFLTVRSRKALLLLLFFISIVPNLLAIGCFDMIGCLPKARDFWVFFDSNTAEIQDFLRQYLEPYILIDVLVFVCLQLYFMGLAWRYAGEYCGKFRRFHLLPILLLFACGLLLPFRAKMPVFDFYKSILNYVKDTRTQADYFAHRKQLHFPVSVPSSEQPRTYVIVIGESATRHHLSLYGYFRPTSPRLDSLRRELFVAEDVCSPSVQTLDCMREILSLANYKHPEYFVQEASIVELFRDAGFSTYWIDNHGKRGLDVYVPTSYRNIAQGCDSLVIFNAVHDGKLLPLYQQFLHQPAADKVIFVHLRGSHSNYRSRYPQAFDFFHHTEDSLRAICDKEGVLATIDAYDNSIRYTDYVLGCMIDSLRACPGEAFLLYLPDHGEEVYDSQCYAGRTFDTLSRGMCDVPFVLWMNAAYRQAHTDLYFGNTHAPFCTDDAMYGMMQLAGMQYPLYDPTKSLFSPQFTPKKRMVGRYEYDSLPQ